MFGLKPSELTGPLEQFQATPFAEEEEVRKLVANLNERLDKRNVPDSVWKNAFKAFWPTLKEKVDGILARPPAEEKTIVRSPGELAEENLMRTRELAHAIERLSIQMEMIWHTVRIPEASRKAAVYRANVALPDHEVRRFLAGLREHTPPRQLASLWTPIAKTLSIEDPSFKRASQLILLAIRTADADLMLTAYKAMALVYADRPSTIGAFEASVVGLMVGLQKLFPHYVHSLAGVVGAPADVGGDEAGHGESPVAAPADDQEEQPPTDEDGQK